VFINEQFPNEIEKLRNILRPILKLAKSQNVKATLSKNKLIISGKLYTVDTIGAIILETKDIATITTDQHIFFNGCFNPSAICTLKLMACIFPALNNTTNTQMLYMKRILPMLQILW
jgi:hypothetical protein